MTLTKPEKLCIARKAWISGFVDGEGYIGIVRQRKKEDRSQSPTLQYHPLVIISNTQKESIKKIQEWTGMGKIVEINSKSPRWKKSYQLKITKFNEIETILNEIKDYFLIKRPQAELLLQFIEFRKSANIITGRGKRGSTSFGEKEELIYQELRKYNGRGF